MSNPAISTIIPVYNTGKYLERCIISVLNQTFQNFEIILIDDGSTDGSGKLCDEFTKRDNRIRVVHQVNGGVSKARNKGLELANGEFIHFADSDDFFEGEFYSDCYQIASSYNADICCCTSAIENKDGYFVKGIFDDKITVFDKGEALFELLACKKISYSLCDKLFRKSTISRIRLNEAIFHNEDFLFCYDAIKDSDIVVYTSKPYHYYCFNEGSAVNSSFNKRKITAVDAQTKVYEDICRSFPELKQSAGEQYCKVILYLSSQIAKSGYPDKEDRTRLRSIIRNHLLFILLSKVSIGYKINALALAIGWKILEITNKRH